MMEDFTEVLARESKKSDSNEAPVFKRPVIIGKRPGGSKTNGSNTLSAKNSNESDSPSPAESNRHAGKEVATKESAEQSAQNVSKKSPAEIEREKQVPLPYREPAWSGICTCQYNLEVLKSGVIVQNLDLTRQPFFVLGRLSNCDVVLEHPSISRYHVVLQYRSAEEDAEQEKGWYLYDLGSTHGTFLNKQQLLPKTYYRIRAGHVFKIGVSTRMFILQGPSEDEEPESEMTVTQLKELRKKREAMMNDLDEKDEAKQAKSPKSESAGESDGIDWGMGEDAYDENPQADNPFAMEVEGLLNEDLYLDDPKKTLRGWFEREGYDLEYKVEERGYANFVCRVELPIETSSGTAITAEASVKGGKKKEAVVQCALEACRILDRHGLLRQSTHESKRQRKKRPEDEDYYSSDEDTFLDRTGAAERKRQARLRATQKTSQPVETHESLTAKYKTLLEELDQVRTNLAEATEKSRKKCDADADDLDAYMLTLQEEASGHKKVIAKLKARLNELTKEELRLRKLINVTKPTLMPELPSPEKMAEAPQDSSKPDRATQPAPPLPQTKSETEATFQQPASVGPTGPSKTLESVPGETTRGTRAASSSGEASDGSKRSESAPGTAGEASEVVPKSKSRQEEAGTKSAKRKQVSLGPLLPPDLLKRLRKENQEEEKAKADETAPPADDQDPSEREKSGLIIRKKQKTTQVRPETQKPAASVAVEYDASDTSKYAMWVPPEDQAGDGKTALNKKFGY